MATSCVCVWTDEDRNNRREHEGGRGESEREMNLEKGGMRRRRRRRRRGWRRRIEEEEEEEERGRVTDRHSMATRVHKISSSLFLHQSC